MRDGVSVSGGYAKDTWTQCAPYATLDADVRFESDVASATELDRFWLLDSSPKTPSSRPPRAAQRSRARASVPRATAILGSRTTR
jgi:hypothetical protein